jgi:hypothetical protein
MARRNRGGRKRKQGVEREPNGRASRSQPDTSPALIRRAALVGEAEAKNQKAGEALGILQLRGVITDRQYEAGDNFRALWRQWARLLGSPPRYQPIGNGAPPAPPLDDELLSDDEKKAMRAQFERVWNDLAKLSQKIAALASPALVWASMESVAVDDMLPEQWLAAVLNPLDQRTLSAFRSGLDAAADYFRIGHKQAA